MSSTLQTRKGIEQFEPNPEEILNRALAGEEIGVEEAERLFLTEGKELHALVQAADELRRRSVGDTVTFVKNRNMNFTNICLGSCKFCAFRRAPSDPDAYVLNSEQIEGKVREALTTGATEVCVQGGLHPSFGLENYLEILRTIRKVSPSIHIHAFSPAEMDYIAEREDMKVEEVIKALIDNGLNSVPGTAAEILVNPARSIICPKKITAAKWISIIKTCHRLKLPTTATMLYGHVETPRERAQHLEIIRNIQKETTGFTEFIPLAFFPTNTQLKGESLVTHSPNVTESLKVHAVARLMLAGHIHNIQASWVKLGPRVAQLMLGAGANDLGGTLLEENITHAAGGNRQKMSAEELEQLILACGRVPRQRTTTYELL